MSARARLLAATALASVITGLAPAPAEAVESDLEDATVTESVKETETKMETGLQEEKPPPSEGLPRLWSVLPDLPPFLRDTRLTLKPRMYYFRRSQEDHVKREAATYGGSLLYRSGWFRETLSVGAEVFTTQKIEGSRGRTGTRLLRGEQHGFTVLGQAWARLRYEGHEFTAGRQVLKLPFVNGQDSRMIPNAHEGYLLRGSLPRVDYLAGYLTKMKARDDDDFISMSESAGVAGTSSKGMAILGFRVAPFDGLQIGAVEYYVKDTLSTFYGEADYSTDLSEELAIRVRGQFIDQRSVGRDLLLEEAFDTWQAGAYVAFSYKGATFRASGSTVGSEMRLRTPFGSYPGFTSLMQRDFKRAGEDTWLVGASYDFKRVGVEGLSSFFNVARGVDARDSSGELADETEFNLTVDYKREGGALRNAWFRVRWSSVKFDGIGKWRNELRIILNYRFSIL